MLAFVEQVIQRERCPRAAQERVLARPWLHAEIGEQPQIDGGHVREGQTILAGRADFYSQADFRLDTSAAPLEPTFQALRTQVREALQLPT